MSFSTDMLEAAHRHGASHKKEVQASDVCGCFYCQQTYPPSEIEDWLKETGGELSQRPDPWTALCPRCGIDSVIGDASGFPVMDSVFLKAMHDFWFERTLTIDEFEKTLSESKPKSFLARMRGWLNQKTA